MLKRRSGMELSQSSSRNEVSLSIEELWPSNSSSNVFLAFRHHAILNYPSLSFFCFLTLYNAGYFVFGYKSQLNCRKPFWDATKSMWIDHDGIER